MRRFIFALIIGGQLASACISISGDRILAKDVAAVIPGFRALPENSVLSYAPMPGAVRVFERSELESIARAHHVVLSEVQAVCFKIPQLERLPEEQAKLAMKRILPTKATLEVVELPKFSVPDGEIHFPVEGIDPPQPSDPSIQNWKGYVRYAGTRRFPVWARVRIQIEQSILVAKQNLKPGDTITADSIAIEAHRSLLRAEPVAATVDQALGRTVHHAIRAGDAIVLSMLDQLAVIHRGDPVKVEVLYGSAHLLLSAVAESNAREGEPVQLRNPASGKIFRARAAGVGSAVIAVGTSSGGKSE